MLFLSEYKATQSLRACCKTVLLCLNQSKPLILHFGGQAFLMVALALEVKLQSFRERLASCLCFRKILAHASHFAAESNQLGLLLIYTVTKEVILDSAIAEQIYPPISLDHPLRPAAHSFKLGEPCRTLTVKLARSCLI